MKNLSVFFCLFLSVMTTGGCVVKELGQTVKGGYYLNSGQSEEGRESFRHEVKENPDSAIANYYYGRFLLQENANREALPYLKKARDLEPGNGDYHFWAGVAFGANGMTSEEEKSYREALHIDPVHLQALIYLGHNRLAKKKYKEALALYTQALDLEPDNLSALYNRALVLHKLGRTEEESIAWLEYLSIYPSGERAVRATEYLNLTRNYSFRNHTLAGRTVTVEKIRFISSSSELDASSHESLLVIGKTFTNIWSGTLQVVTYQKGNKELAHQRAIAIKKYLLENIPSISSEQIGISWFAEPQKMTIKKKRLTIDESVSFFVTMK